MCEFSNGYFPCLLMFTQKNFYEIFFNFILDGDCKIIGDTTPQFVLISLKDFK